MVTVQEVQCCRFSSWYNDFRGITAESISLPLEELVKSSLLQDSIYMPKNAHRPEFTPLSDSEDDSTLSDDSSQSQTTDKCPEFPDFERTVTEAIGRLGGTVFPKLDWSAPKDASWMLCGNSLKCSNFSDIYLLLKASDFIAHDLSAPFALCTDLPPEQTSVSFEPTLVLRRWVDYRPEGEFRCFIREGIVIGICQRNHDTHFASILNDAEHIVGEAMRFLREHILPQFPLKNYTVDVYRDTSKRPPHWSLVDFNVFGCPTDGLLFTWEHLVEAEMYQNHVPEFRCQMNPTIQPNVFRQYSVPVDLIDIASGSDPQKLMDLVQNHVEQQTRDTNGA